MVDKKIKSLNKYLNELKNKLSSSVPSKHINRPASYKAFLLREIDVTSNKLESLKNK